jgi:hypothetical protein
MTLPKHGISTMIAAVGVLTLLWAAHGTAASRLAGTWQLDKSKGELPGGQATFDSTLVVDVSGDVVTAKRTGFIGVIFMFDRYELDGRPHSYLFCDTVPDQQTGVRVASWLPDAEGFKVVEGASTALWTVSSDGQLLTIETTIQRPCPPCYTNPRIDHTVYVFARQP